MKRKELKRIEVDFDKYFSEDADQFYELMTDYYNLTTEDYAGAFILSQKAMVLASRWNDLSANAGKLATKDISKTELTNFTYRRYRLMQDIHEQCSIIHAIGEKQNPNIRRA